MDFIGRLTLTAEDVTLTEDEVEDVVTRIRTALESIGQDLGQSHKVAARLKREGVKGKALTPQDEAEIVQLRREGLGYKQLAENYGVSTGAINKVLQAAGLTKMHLSEEARAREAAEREEARKAKEAAAKTAPEPTNAE